MTIICRVLTLAIVSALAACGPADVAAPIGDIDAPATARSFVGLDGVERAFETVERRVDGLQVVVDVRVDGRLFTLTVEDYDGRLIELFDPAGLVLSAEQTPDGTTRVATAEGHQLMARGCGVLLDDLEPWVGSDAIAVLAPEVIAHLAYETAGQFAQVAVDSLQVQPIIVVVACSGMQCEVAGRVWTGQEWADKTAKCCCKVGESCTTTKSDSEVSCKCVKAE